MITPSLLDVQFSLLRWFARMPREGFQDGPFGCSERSRRVRRRKRRRRRCGEGRRRSFSELRIVKFSPARLPRAGIGAAEKERHLSSWVWDKCRPSTRGLPWVARKASRPDREMGICQSASHVELTLRYYIAPMSFLTDPDGYENEYGYHLSIIPPYRAELEDVLLSTMSDNKGYSPVGDARVSLSR